VELMGPTQKGNQTWFAGKSRKFPHVWLLGGSSFLAQIYAISMAGIGKASESPGFHGGVRDSMKNKPGSLKSTWFCVQCRDAGWMWNASRNIIYAIWRFKTMGKAGIKVT
jgi:hypothetical protein